MITIRIIFWLIVVTVIVALMANQYRKTGKPFPWLRALGTIVIVLILSGISSCSYHAWWAKPTTQQVTATTPAQQVVQMPDRTTPCTIDIGEIRDIYTDGEAIYALPPGWPEDKAIYYSGKGHLIIQGGNIHAGLWGFWSATDKNKAALVRVFTVK